MRLGLDCELGRKEGRVDYVDWHLALGFGYLMKPPSCWCWEGPMSYDYYFDRIVESTMNLRG